MNAYEGNEKYIFVSYSHKDSKVVLPIIEDLSMRGFRIWYDSGIEAGSEWPEYIEQHLIGAAVFLAFISPSAVASINCRNEINLARADAKETLVVFLEPTELVAGMRLQLSSVQAISLFNFQNYDSFINTLSTTKILSPCNTGSTDKQQEERQSDNYRNFSRNQTYHSTQNNFGTRNFGFSSEPQTFTLTVSRMKQFFLVNPDIEMTFNDRIYYVKKNVPISIQLKEGFYTFNFAASFRKKQLTLNLTKDTEIVLSWNRLTGEIEAEEKQ